MGSDKKIAIFDIDGTLLSGHSLFHFVVDLMKQGVFPQDKMKAINSLMKKYVSNAMPYEEAGSKALKIVAEGFAGMRSSDLEDRSSKFFKSNKALWFDFSSDLLELFRKKGYKVIIISGSLVEVLDSMQTFLGEFEYYGTKFEIKDGIFTGRIKENAITFLGKKRIIDELFSKYGNSGSFGFGDTESDLGFLEKVESKVVIDPNPILRSMAEEDNWHIFMSTEDVLGKVRNLLGS